MKSRDDLDTMDLTLGLCMSIKFRESESEDPEKIATNIATMCYRHGPRSTNQTT